MRRASSGAPFKIICVHHHQSCFESSSEPSFLHRSARSGAIEIGTARCGKLIRAGESEVVAAAHQIHFGPPRCSLMFADAAFSCSWPPIGASVFAAKVEN
jgi:hypothetical protein